MCFDVIPFSFHIILVLNSVCVALVIYNIGAITMTTREQLTNNTNKLDNNPCDAFLKGLICICVDVSKYRRVKTQKNSAANMLYMSRNNTYITVRHRGVYGFSMSAKRCHDTPSCDANRQQFDIDSDGTNDVRFTTNNRIGCDW